jgi:hypothetical protein
MAGLHVKTVARNNIFQIFQLKFEEVGLHQMVSIGLNMWISTIP